MCPHMTNLLRNCFNLQFRFSHFTSHLPKHLPAQHKEGIIHLGNPFEMCTLARLHHRSTLQACMSVLPSLLQKECASEGVGKI